MLNKCLIKREQREFYAKIAMQANHFYRLAINYTLRKWHWIRTKYLSFYNMIEHLKVIFLWCKIMVFEERYFDIFIMQKRLSIANIW